MLKISPNTAIGHPGLEVSAETLEDLQTWKDSIDEASNKAKSIAKKEVRVEGMCVCFIFYYFTVA